MSNRVMSCKGFLFKAGTKAANSATAFLSQHREWLTTGELAQVCSPILAKVDSKELMPTPALNEIKVAVLNHMLIMDAQKAEKSMNGETSSASSKNVLAQVFNADGTIATRVKKNGDVEDLIDNFNLGQEAMRWVDRRLFDAAPGCYATVTHMNPAFEDTITRDEAIERILRKPKGAVLKASSKSTSKLSFGVKVKQDTANFSRG